MVSAQRVAVQIESRKIPKCLLVTVFSTGFPTLHRHSFGPSEISKELIVLSGDACSVASVVSNSL